MSKITEAPTVDHYVYCRYRVVKGKRIYPKNGKVFRFPVYKEKGSAKTET